jgi:uncharacterized protein (DUF4415 family)
MTTKSLGSYQHDAQIHKKGSYMLEKIVSYKAGEVPLPTEEDERLYKLAMAKPDSEIDTSDIPELTEEQFRTAVRGKFYRPVKAQITAMVDMDVLAWLKSQGAGYQTRMNAILRREMLSELDKTT